DGALSIGLERGPTGSSGFGASGGSGIFGSEFGSGKWGLAGFMGLAASAGAAGGKSIGFASPGTEGGFTIGAPGNGANGKLSGFGSAFGMGGGSITGPGGGTTTTPPLPFELGVLGLGRALLSAPGSSIPGITVGGGIGLASSFFGLIDSPGGRSNGASVIGMGLLSLDGWAGSSARAGMTWGSGFISGNEFGADRCKEVG